MVQKRFSRVVEFRQGLECKFQVFSLLAIVNVGDDRFAAGVLCVERGRDLVSLPYHDGVGMSDDAVGKFVVM